MFKLRNQNVDAKHYQNTLKEISHQPEKWKIAFENYNKYSQEIDDFLKSIEDSSEEKVRVVFTGAGTSEYVGNIIADYLGKNDRFRFESIATTDIVSSPYIHLKNEPTLLVSFARSGNSPESLAAVKLADKLIDNIHHLAITCSPEGKLAQQLGTRDDSYVLLMPEGTNDKGFAMTSSFSSMMLSSLLIFDTLSDEEKKTRVEYITKQADYVLSQEDRINELGDFEFDRIIYLGSGPLYGLTNECRLKILELTAGNISSMYESSLGFRHGPKSYVDDKTFIVGLVSNNDYTRQYDLDILNEIHGDNIARKILALSPKKLDVEFEQFVIDTPENIEDVYIALVYVIIAQLFSVMASVYVGNETDTPSKTGTVNRVVKGVTIHEYK
ncbi:AgaS family putative sugar isomerase [Helcococcus kunzii ATCC 51366]|uniref:AgaS family putative sugar isomerase n=1 Tax=Helcococcus kunzii ATCC 51366 TaxID=883114 RepID=H3NQ60_9FIRM|nr:SIS domain-containing protein [Helcococcus kunzii]EHR32540.1 AgaS family putative sugar isomerase [Helcococcus kunzii ATCC 51366]